MDNKDISAVIKKEPIDSDNEEPSDKIPSCDLISASASSSKSKKEKGKKTKLKWIKEEVCDAHINYAQVRKSHIKGEHHTKCKRHIKGKRHLKNLKKGHADVASAIPIKQEAPDMEDVEGLYCSNSHGSASSSGSSTVYEGALTPEDDNWRLVNTVYQLSEQEAPDMEDGEGLYYSNSNDTASSSGSSTVYEEALTPDDDNWRNSYFPQPSYFQRNSYSPQPGPSGQSTAASSSHRSSAGPDIDVLSWTPEEQMRVLKELSESLIPENDDHIAAMREIMFIAVQKVLQYEIGHYPFVLRKTGGG